MILHLLSYFQYFDAILDCQGPLCSKRILSTKRCSPALKDKTTKRLNAIKLSRFGSDEFVRYGQILGWNNFPSAAGRIS
jgi:hypothetical protein